MEKRLKLVDELDENQREEFIALCNNVKYLREEMNMTQNELAVKANCSKSTVSGLESQTYFPSGIHLFNIAKTLKKSVAELFLERYEIPMEEEIEIFPKRPRIHPSEKELNEIKKKYANGIPEGTIEEMVDRYL